MNAVLLRMILLLKIPKDTVPKIH